MVERETVRTEELNGFCLEVNQSGMLVQYKHRGNVVTDFVPWPHIKRVRHVESEKTKHRA